jgi:cell division protein FtsQ
MRLRGLRTGKRNQGRLRRKKPSRKSLTRKTAKKKNVLWSRQTQFPPVITRGTKDISRPPRKQSKFRRRYDIALNVPGAEVRLPTLPSIKFGWRLVSGSMVLLLICILFNFLNAPTYLIQNVSIKGLERLSPRDVNLVLGLENASIFSVEIDQIKGDLLDAFQEFSSVNVEVGWPNILIITVEERQPVLVWKAANITVWVDKNGIAFNRREDNDSLPVVDAQNSSQISLLEVESGVFPQRLPAKQILSPEMVSAILGVRDSIPDKAILQYDDDHGIGWKDPRGWRVYLGKESLNVAQKMKIYKAIKKELVQDGIQPEYVSVEYLHAPYYRLDQ